MKAPERDELLVELRTAVLGVKGSEEKGIAGDVSDIKDSLGKLNGSQRKLATKVNILWGVAIVLTGGTGFSLSQLIG